MAANGSAKPKRKWIVGIMSNPRRRGRWRASESISCLAFWGGVDLDFRNAVFEAQVIDIRAWAIMGGVDIVVPEGINVEVDGFVLMGGLEDRVKDSTAPIDAPCIRVHGYGMWGGVRVRTKAEGQRSRSDIADRARDLALGHAEAALERALGHIPPPLPVPPPHPGERGRERHDARHQERRDRRAERDRAQPGQMPQSEQWGQNQQAAQPAQPAPPAPSEGLIDQVAREGAPAESEPPSGTVTILFTDIAHSTEMAERIGDQRWMGVLGAHNALVREQLNRHGGTEVKHHGDGFMAVFPSARRALLCSIGIQRSMAGYRQGHPDTPIDVRIGLHTGEVIAEDGDYFGRNVILAARIAAAAGGGEILASSLVKELADSGGDLGFDGGRDVELKGMSRPWRVHTVNW
jgi:class 3 adenylate cyclase